MPVEAKCYFGYTRYAIEGACELYDIITREVPPDDKSLAWQRYCQSVSESLLAPVLGFLQVRGATIQDMCLLALKLAEVVGTNYALVREYLRDEGNKNAH